MLFEYEHEYRDAEYEKTESLRTKIPTKKEPVGLSNRLF